MASGIQRIDFDEFAANLQRVFEDVRDRQHVVLVEREGEVFRLEKGTAEDIWVGYDPIKVQEALRASAGALKGVDREALLRDIYAQREQGMNRHE